MSLAARRIPVLAGDGIGPAVCRAAVSVLQAAGLEADYAWLPVGWSEWQKRGRGLPEETLQAVQEAGVALFGAITSRPEPQALAQLPPRLQGIVSGYQSPVLELRRRLDLQVALRPSPCLLLGPGFDPEPFRGRRVRVAVVFQNTEGHYAGLEWDGLPPGSEEAFVRRAGQLGAVGLVRAMASGERLATSCRVLSLESCRQASRRAFEIAERYGLGRVVLCDKVGVLQKTASLFWAAARQEAARWPGIELAFWNADTLLAHLVSGRFSDGVILAGALLGDLASDVVAALSGGIGLAACANLGERVAVFEPVHGSAPKYANREPQVVNPSGAILAASLLAEHLGEREVAARIRSALAKVLSEGRALTFDLLGLPGDRDVLSLGASDTVSFTQAVCRALG